MHRVIEAIDRRLDQPLDLASLAAVAHFSPYHFHRLFAAWTGETLGDYLRRRRVEQAASRLAVAAAIVGAASGAVGGLRIGRSVLTRVQGPIRLFAERVAITPISGQQA